MDEMSLDKLKEALFYFKRDKDRKPIAIVVSNGHVSLDGGRVVFSEYVGEKYPKGTYAIISMDTFLNIKSSMLFPEPEVHFAGYIVRSVVGIPVIEDDDMSEEMLRRKFIYRRNPSGSYLDMGWENKFVRIIP